MRTEKLQAFVLSAVDYGESDRIVSLFTLEHGRIRGFARRARKSQKRFGAAFELLARIELHAECKEGLSALKQAESLSVFPRIRSDLSLISVALYSTELIDILTPEGQPLPRLFRLFSAWMERLESMTATPEQTIGELRFFEINLLNILGYRPAIDHCSCCGNEYEQRGALLQANGELACRNCARLGTSISSNTLSLLQRSLKTGLFSSVSFSPENLAQAGKILGDALVHHAGRQIKSLGFLNQIWHT